MSFAISRPSCYCLLVKISKSLLGVLDCTVDIEGSDVDFVGTLGYVLELGNVSQAFELGLVKDLFLDL